MSNIKENPENAEDKLDFKKILPVFIIVFIDLLGLTIIIPLLPLYAASFGADPFLIGILSATYPLMQFFGAPLLGRLSDRFGRRPILLLSQVGTLIGFLILGFANTLWLLFLSRLIDGISGANIATAQAVITDSTTEKTRTQGLGLIGAAFGLGFIIGPVIAFITLGASGNNYAIVAYVAATFSLISILLTYFWLKETLPPEKRGQGEERPGVNLKAMFTALGKPKIGFLLALMFFFQFAFGGYEYLLSLFTLNRLGMNASSNSGLFVYAGIIIVAVQGYFVGKWSKRFGDRWLILFGLIVLGAGLILTAVTPQQPVPWYSQSELKQEMSTEASNETTIQVNLPNENNKSWLGFAWLLVATIPASIGGGIMQPTINSILSKQVSAQEVGGTLGMSSAFFSAANAITPVILGAVFKWLGSTWPFLIAGGILLLLYPITQPRLPEESGKQ
jgi:DHA1 family tetracycline resistance protein-like MFS transporter